MVSPVVHRTVLRVVASGSTTTSSSSAAAAAAAAFSGGGGGGTYGSELFTVFDDEHRADGLIFSSRTTNASSTFIDKMSLDTLPPNSVEATFCILEGMLV